ncbi:hypothetical protein Chor_002101 [Crotalus horridus]
MEEEVDELSLVNHTEIMSRLTLRQEGDDGPDVRGGSGDILLVHATETATVEGTVKDLVLYCEAFLTTYRTFISPEELIKKLQYRYPFEEGDRQNGASSVGWLSLPVVTSLTHPPTYEKFCHCPDNNKKRVSKNTFFVLVRVVDELWTPAEFHLGNPQKRRINCSLVDLKGRLHRIAFSPSLVELTEEILKLLMELVFRLVCNGELSLARVLRKNILDKVNQRKMLRYTNSIKPLAARWVAARPGTLHDFHSHEISEQLTLLDAELFYKIEIPEVLLWAKEQNEEKSPNLTQVRSIIMQQEKSQDRERLLLKFIKIMKVKLQLGTAEGGKRAATARSLSEALPLSFSRGLILQDLTFVHLGNPDYIDGKVNFSKRWQQFNILDNMRRFQQVHYDIKRNDDIISFFNDFSDHLAEEALWELSLKIKPRNITRRKTDREEKT